MVWSQAVPCKILCQTWKIGNFFFYIWLEPPRPFLGLCSLQVDRSQPVTPFRQSIQIWCRPKIPKYQIDIVKMTSWSKSLVFMNTMILYNDTCKVQASGQDHFAPLISTQLSLLRIKCFNFLTRGQRIHSLASRRGALPESSGCRRSTPDSSKVSRIAAILRLSWFRTHKEKMHIDIYHLNAICLGRPSSSSTGCIRKGLGPSGGGFKGSGRSFCQLGWRSSLASTPPGNTNAFGMNLLRLLL